MVGGRLLSLPCLVDHLSKALRNGVILAKFKKSLKTKRDEDLKFELKKSNDEVATRSKGRCCRLAGQPLLERYVAIRRVGPLNFCLTSCGHCCDISCGTSFDRRIKTNDSSKYTVLDTLTMGSISIVKGEHVPRTVELNRLCPCELRNYSSIDP